MFTRKILQDQNAPAYALLVILLKRYGLEAIDWEPELMRQTMESDYQIQLTELQHDKLQAAILVFSSNWFETSWRVFEHCCQLFSNQATDHGLLNPLEPEQIAIAVSEATLIKETTIKYDDEIRAYVGLILADWGCSKPPSIFPTALMPKTSGADDSEKEKALKEIFDTHAAYVLDYVENIE